MGFCGGFGVVDVGWSRRGVCVGGREAGWLRLQLRLRLRGRWVLPLTVCLQAWQWQSQWQSQSQLLPCPAYSRQEVCVRDSHALHTHTPAPTAIAMQPCSQPASPPVRYRARQPWQRMCNWSRRIVCARFGRVRRRGVIRGGGGGGGGVHHSCCNLLAWDSGVSAPTILTDFCLFVSEGDGLAGCGDVCSSFSDQLCELVRLAKAKLARPHQIP